MPKAREDWTAFVLKDYGRCNNKIMLLDHIEALRCGSLSGADSRRPKDTRAGDPSRREDINAMLRVLLITCGGPSSLSKDILVTEEEDADKAGELRQEWGQFIIGVYRGTNFSIVKLMFPRVKNSLLLAAMGFGNRVGSKPLITHSGRRAFSPSRQTDRDVQITLAWFVDHLKLTLFIVQTQVAFQQ